MPVLANSSYFIAPEAALMEPEAALMADEAASIAEVAAEEAASIAEVAAADAASVEGVVTMVVVAAGAGMVVVVDVSSFLLHAANETAAARVTISSAVFMFLLDFRFGQLLAIVGTLLSRSPSVFKTWKASIPLPSPQL